jgi:hypothetical protein
MLKWQYTVFSSIPHALFSTEKMMEQETGMHASVIIRMATHLIPGVILTFPAYNFLFLACAYPCAASVSEC